MDGLPPPPGGPPPMMMGGEGLPPPQQQMQPLPQEQQQQTKQEGHPNPTIYVQNINEKIRGEKLRRGLKQVFTPFGKIRKICMRKSFKLRGQAFIIYDTMEATAAAIEKVQNFSFYGKPLRLAYAINPSDLTAKKHGMEPPRRPAHPKKGMVAVKLEGQKPKPAPTAMPVAQPFTPGGGYAMPYGLMPPGAGGGASNGGLGPAPPNNVLLAENLPDDVSKEMLMTLFQQYPGLKEVRMIPGRQIAFIDFGSEAEASVALQGLKEFKLTPTHTLALSYARR